MSVLQASLFSSTGEATGKFDFPESLTAKAGSLRVLHETIVALHANQRRGTSSTKTRGLVRGGGRKPWKQKGTGNARAGSIRSPLWRGGGIIFGPLPRSYRIDLDDVKKQIALKTALVERVKSSSLSVIDSLKLSGSKTSEASKIFKKTGLEGRLLLVVDKKEALLGRGMRNLRSLTILEASEVNARHLFMARHVLVTKSAVDILVNRLPKG